MGGDSTGNGRPGLLLRGHLDEPFAMRCAGGPAAVITRASPLRSGPDGNEDGALVLDLGEGLGVLAVADGVGGSPGGAQAAAAALSTLADVAERGVREGSELRVAIVDGIEQAQEAVRAIGGGAATTIAVVGLERHTARPFHAGDSEILLVGQRGRLRHRSVSHAPVAYAVDSGYLGEREALHHDDRHLLSNALGMPELRIEVGPSLRVAPFDTLVLATDGLTDNLYLNEIVQRVRAGPIGRRATEVARVATARMRAEDEESARPGKADDLTFILWRRPR